MAIEKSGIEEFLRQAKDALLLDVRSPGEYAHAHIPGAFNLPLFDDEERRQVGTAYKQQSRETAIKIGLDFFGPKMRTMVETVEGLLANRQIPDKSQPGGKKVLLHCWRGGMRSAAIAWLLDLYGFRVTTLAGGYKKFRHWVLSRFEQEYPLQILGGYTGSGKTYLIKALAKTGARVIDLEHLASHKGSAFGNIGLPPQPSQEMFENLLAMELERWLEGNQDGDGPLWLEDESQRIGKINLPQPFWNSMRAAPVTFVDIPFEARLQHILQEYGALDKDRMCDAIERIKKRLGPLETKMALEHLRTGNTADSFRILLTYYDKYYKRGLFAREKPEEQINIIPCESVSPAENIKRLLK